MANVLPFPKRQAVRNPETEEETHTQTLAEFWREVVSLLPEDHPLLNPKGPSSEHRAEHEDLDGD